MYVPSINGVPACANKQLLTDITRKEWGFQGYVVSDSGAVSNIISAHKYLNNSVDTVTAAIKAGTNLELGSDVYNSQLEALKQGDGDYGCQLPAYYICIDSEGFEDWVKK